MYIYLIVYYTKYLGKTQILIEYGKLNFHTLLVDRDGEQSGYACHS